MGRWRWAIVAMALGFAALMWFVATGGDGARMGTPRALVRGAKHVASDTRAAERDTQPALAAQPESLGESAATASAEAPGSEDWPEAFEQIRVVGRVLDLDGAPCVGAEVQLLADEVTARELWRHAAFAERVEAERARTDDAGRFELLGPWVRGSGFRTPRSRAFPVVRVRAAGFVPVDASCAGFAGGDHDVGDVSMVQRAAGLRVRVVDTHGAPLEGVSVKRGSASGTRELQALGYRFDALGSLDVRTDAAGLAEQHDLWPIRMEVSLTHAEHPRRTHEWVQLVAGETLDLGQVVLDPGMQLRGVVRDEHGAPLVGARVAVGHESWLGESRAPAGSLDLAYARSLRVGEDDPQALTDAAGEFALTLARADATTLALIASADGHEPAFVAAHVPGDAPFELTLRPEARLRVLARDATTGLEVTPSRVIACRRSGEWWGTRPQSIPLPVEDTLVRGVGALSTLLVVEAEGYTQTQHEVEGVEPGALREVTVTLQPAREFELRVVDARGAPIEGASVSARPQGDVDVVLTRHGTPLTERTDTDAEGRAVFLGLTPSAWRVDVAAEGFCDGSVELVIEPGSDLAHTLELERSGSLRGVVRDASGAPAVAVPMRLDSAYRGREQLTDIEGRFAFESLAPGEWWLEGELVPRVDVVLAPAEERTLALNQGAPAVIEVSVRRNGSPLEGQYVRLNGPSGGDVLGLVFRSEQTSAAGLVRYELTWPGSYHVVAASPEGATHEREVEVELQNTERIEFDFEAGSASISGVLRVIGPEQPAAVRHRIFLRRDDEVVQQIWQGAGSFRFEGLPAGTYFVQAWGNAISSTEAGPFHLDDGEQLRDVALEAVMRARLGGTVFFANGEPFHGFLHARALDDSGDYRSLSLSAGRLSHGHLRPGTWQLDLAAFRDRELGPGGRGEPGAELPFFAREVVTLEPGETRELDIVIPGGPP